MKKEKNLFDINSKLIVTVFLFFILVFVCMNVNSIRKTIFELYTQSIEVKRLSRLDILCFFSFSFLLSIRLKCETVRDGESWRRIKTIQERFLCWFFCFAEWFWWIGLFFIRKKGELKKKKKKNWRSRPLK